MECNRRQSIVVIQGIIVFRYRAPERRADRRPAVQEGMCDGEACSACKRSEQFLTMLNGSVAMPLMVTPLTCMADDDPARGYIIGATLFVSGITTLLQATFGTRSEYQASLGTRSEQATLGTRSEQATFGARSDQVTFCTRSTGRLSQCSACSACRSWTVDILVPLFLL
ncbi:Solute carrier family 23 member 2 [Amphibalanus amphitrite]|uniref:Solute carrier family 23 member 2 n=1 Tax=Amphibalanus amphitrite TaxID=1232801 RepID=A0A6A4W3A0_AMPAM|nr:Solute carrier family 23 member 2 [Amphibalanus amphitrite]